MSAEDDDLRMLKTMLAGLTSEARSPEDLGRNLINSLAQSYDDYIVESRLAASERNESSGNCSGNALVQYFRRFAYALKYGTFSPPDIRAEGLLAALESGKQISAGQRRVLNIYRMVNLQQDGRCEILCAPRQSYARAKRYLAMAAFLSPAALYLSWEILPPLTAGIPCAYTLGALLGWLWRDGYDRAWGRDQLAKKLKMLLPWMTLRMQH